MNAALTGPLSALLGASLWVPAIGLELPGAMLQPSELLAAPCLAVLVLAAVFRAGRISRPALAYSAFFILGLMSTWSLAMAGAPLWSDAVVYFAYYLLFVLPFLLVTLMIGLDRVLFRFFCRGYLIAGTASAAIGVLELVEVASASLLRNNENFRLIEVPGRSSALTPEPSTLAQLLMIAIALLCLRVYVRRQAATAHPAAPSQTLWQGGKARTDAVAIPLIALLAVAMIGTQTFLLFLFPPLLFLAVKAAVPSRRAAGGVQIGFRIFGVLLAAALVAVAVSLYYTIFTSTRDVNIASGSLQNRMSTVLAFFFSLRDMPLLGFGLGNNDAIVPYIDLSKQAFELQFWEITPGINNFLLARIFEEGLPGALVYAGLAVLLFRQIPAVRRGGMHGRELFVVAFFSLMSGLLVTGYRGFFHAWLYCSLTVALAVLVARDRERLRHMPSSWSGATPVRHLHQPMSGEPAVADRLGEMSWQYTAR